MFSKFKTIEIRNKHSEKKLFFLVSSANFYISSVKPHFIVIEPLDEADFFLICDAYDDELQLYYLDFLEYLYYMSYCCFKLLSRTSFITVATHQVIVAIWYCSWSILFISLAKSRRKLPQFLKLGFMWVYLLFLLGYLSVWKWFELEQLYKELENPKFSTLGFIRKLRKRVCC
jgi:hypothetical protein